MGKVWMLSGALVLAAASAAHADQSFATVGSVAPPAQSFELGDSRNVAAADGNSWGLVLSHHNFNLASGPSYTFTFDFNNAPFPSGDPTMILYMTAAAITSGTIKVTSAQWYDRTSATNAVLNGLPVGGYDITLWTNASSGTYPGGGGAFQLPGSRDASNYTASPGFSFLQFDRLILTIQFNGAGGANVDDAVLLFDAVANPEPGTMALFGLGALGLGGYAWRRRRARRTPAAK